MADITASMVKELREMTGAGMMECKKALAEAEGEMEKAVDVLRTRGLAAVAKKAGRATNEGTVMAIVDDACTTGAVVELNCETDFVGMNEKFKAYAEKIAKAALAAALNVDNIYTAEQFEGLARTDKDNVQHKLLGLFVNLADYTVGSTKGGEITRFNQFDIDFNQEKYLIETRLSGALHRLWSAIALEEPVKPASGGGSNP